MKRLFIASKIDLDSHFTSLYQQLKSQSQFDDISWSEPQNLHLTLRFLGKTPDYQIENIINSLSSIFKNYGNLDLELYKIGIFGSRYKPTVIWLGFEDNMLLKSLFSEVEDALIEFGFQPNQGNFVPHLTLGRIKKIDNKKRFNDRIANLQPSLSQKIIIQEWSLYQSILTSDGPIYKILHTWK